ncbi:MAG: hypothetical protein KAI94_08220, partial [Anaerolineales bacterium]|nr:hypothetical protein [Anaerolineales bacterium]
ANEAQSGLSQQIPQTARQRFAINEAVGTDDTDYFARSGLDELVSHVVRIKAFVSEDDDSQSLSPWLAHLC